MVTLAQDGPAAFRDRYELLYRHRAEGPKAIWQADHTLLDILVLDANGEAVRPWLTLILDDYSRAVAGYTIFLGAPTALQTALDLLLVMVAQSRMVRRDGVPFQGLRYMDPTLAVSVGESVTMRYDPRDIAEIR